ncbi:hypothetical protein [Acinetobacter sp. NIPH 298]|uniref:hypothetical protein n=1 Tax=Acinetobacter sp. NIPH 298 TaxID=1217692 RepID=UPI0002CF2017|nr:hypothetical protein [Acinetobacter sp. NIPH 298]ENW95740.1 hypothetical protein F903_01502 [Acinetobacter sp. NIPH 298]
MDIQKERELFEEWAKEKGLTRTRCEDTGVYFNYKTFYAWESWQAAKAHEAEKFKGYVLVPVEPTDAMLFAASGRDIVAEHYGDENILWPELRETWKAMVEAARGGNDESE